MSVLTTEVHKMMSDLVRPVFIACEKLALRFSLFPYSLSVYNTALLHATETRHKLVSKPKAQPSMATE